MEERINPEMIILARQSRFLNQRELAKLLNIPQGKLSKIETGLVSVSDDLLQGLEQVLKYPKGFFFQTSRVYAGDIGFYRKHKTLPAKTLNGIVAEMNIRRVHFERLLKSAEISRIEIPALDPDEHGSPEEIASVIRQLFRLPRGPVANVTKTLEDAGIAICLSSIPSRKFAGVRVLTETPYHLVIMNEDLPGDRWRFTLAHELGHIVMHHLPNPNMEREADRFASEFLMPTHDIQSELYDIKLERLAALKRHWKVAMGAILQKALHLNKVTPNQHRYLWTQMSAAGYRLKEPAELAIPRETPTLLSELVDVYLTELGYTVQELSQWLALQVEEFCSVYLPKVSNRPLRLLNSTAT